MEYSNATICQKKLVQFLKAIFLHHVRDTESMQGHVSHMFEGSPLLNNAFKLKHDDNHEINIIYLW